MTPEEQRIAIAGAVGWKAVRFDFELAHRIHTFPGDCLVGISPINQTMEHGNDETKDFNYWIVPDYTGSLNAMHEAEQFLERTTGHLSVKCLIRDYLLTLMQICLPNPEKELWENGRFLGTWGDCVFAYTATAAQRAEAFLRCLNLWTDTPNPPSLRNDPDRRNHEQQT